MNLKELFLISMIVLSVMIDTAVCQEQDASRERREDKVSPAAQAELRKRLEAIEQELATIKDHPWAGTYHTADTKLSLVPKSGFALLGHSYLDHNYGEVVPTKHGSLRLLFTFENEREGPGGIAPEFILVPWGERRYLIPIDEVVGFCNSINSGYEPSVLGYGLHFLRSGDDKKPTTGAPEIPEKYRAYLLREPVDAEILAVHKTEVEIKKGGFIQYATSVTLNVGRSHKILPGMSFDFYEPRDALWPAVNEVSVVSVDEHTSKARVRHWGKSPAPEVGWKLTTGSRCSKLGTKPEAKRQHGEDKHPEP